MNCGRKSCAGAILNQDDDRGPLGYVPSVIAPTRSVETLSFAYLLPRGAGAPIRPKQGGEQRYFCQLFPHEL